MTFRGSVDQRLRLRQMMGAIAAAVSLVAPVSAQQGRARLLRGTVVDSAGDLIAYANVMIDSRTRVVADDSGRFQLRVDSGRVVSLTLRRISFVEQKLRIPVVQDTSLRVVLAYAVETAPAELTGGRGVQSLDRNGFYRRLWERASEANFRHFITPEDIERRRPSRASQILEGTPGVRMRAGPTGDWAVMGLNRCPMTVYLDRSRLNSMSTRGSPVFIDDVVSGRAIVAVEVYPSGVKPPVEYPPLEGTCGVLLVWTH